MKILFCLNRDIFSIVALNLLRPFIEKNGWKFSIAMTKSVGRDVISDIAKIEKIIPLEGVFPTLERLNVEGKYLTLNGIIKKYNSDFHEVQTINNDLGHSLIERHDLIVSVRFGSIFKEAAIKKAKQGIVNLHSAILPDYRGVLGTFRALKDKKDIIGATIHKISDGTIDTGDIIEVIKFKADYHTTLFDNLLTLYLKAAPVLGEVITALASGETIKTSSQLQRESAYFSHPTLEEIDDFKNQIMPIYHDTDVREMIKTFGCGAAD